MWFPRGCHESQGYTFRPVKSTIETLEGNKVKLTVEIDEVEFDRNIDDAFRKIAQSDADGPVFMLNLNKYVAGAQFPDGRLYKDYMSVLDTLLAQVGGKILWRTAVLGHVVGEQDIDEAIGISPDVWDAIEGIRAAGDVRIVTIPLRMPPTIRPHSALGNIPPAVYAKLSTPEMQRDVALRSLRGLAPRPVASPSQLGSNEGRTLLITG